MKTILGEKVKSKFISTQQSNIRKCILTVMALFFFSFSYGQLLIVGPRVGISSSKVKLKDNIADVREGDAIFGFHAGFFARITMTNVYVQPEILFTSNGGKIEFQHGAAKQIEEYDFNKLDIPIMVGFKLTNFFRVQAGPVANLLLKANATEGGVTRDVKSNYQNATIGYQAGIGLDIGSVLLDLKYEGNISKLGDNVGVGNTTFNTDMRNNQWLLSLGLKL